jgi:hypothetical protein
MIPMSDPTPAYLAARLTLLALRASIPESQPLTLDKVIVAPMIAAVSVDSAAHVLAALPKPTACHAEVVDKTLLVQCIPLAAAEPMDRAVYAQNRSNADEQGGAMAYLEDEHGPGDHVVAAFGRDESLRLSSSVVDEWNRDYVVRGAGWSGDDVNNPRGKDEPNHVAARQMGAVGLLRFRAPSASGISVVIGSSGENLSPAERARTDSLLIESARLSLILLRNSSDDSTPIPAGATKRQTWLARQRENAGEHMLQKATFMEEYFRGRTMPADVAAFVAEARRRYAH